MSIIIGVSLVSFVITICLLICIQFYWKGRTKDVKNRHVVVTGGSSGIGKAVAIIAAQHGAHVTIVARDIQKLESAREEIIHACVDKDNQKVEYLSLDITKSYEAVEKAISDLERTMGPVFMLVNCAGLAICGKVEDTTAEDLSTMINTNLIGTYYCIKAVVPRMKTAREGSIVLTGSQASLIGIFGYSGYCSTKFALRGLAECLSMELTPYDITVTLSLPPDTDTPGFAVEEFSKPLETKLISETASLVSPETVAECLFKDALSGKFFSTVGLQGFILSNLCCGMAPFKAATELLLQSILMGFLRIISACYLISFQRIIQNCIETRNKNKKSE